MSSRILAIAPITGFRDFRRMDAAEIRRRLAAVNATQVELAKFMNIKKDKVNRIVTGERKHLRQDELDKILRFLEMREEPSYDPAVGRDEPMDGNVGNEMRYMPPGRAEIPLFGGLDTAQGWMLSLSNRAQVGRVMAHPAQHSARRAFAVEVVDDAMVPRFLSGDIAYVAGGKMPRSGQDCLVEAEDLTARILIFVERTPTHYVFRQLQPDRRVTRAIGEKLQIHAIVGRG